LGEIVRVLGDLVRVLGGLVRVEELLVVGNLAKGFHAR
jgi:hypothetical protein